MTIIIESSKRANIEMVLVMIAKTGKQLCPVENLDKLIKWGGLPGNDYLFVIYLQQNIVTEFVIQTRRCHSQV